MTKSLNKIQKKLSRKGANINSLHENSRNSQRLRGGAGRDDKLARVGTARAKANLPHLQRVSHFQDAANVIFEPFSLPTVQSLIQSWIGRSSTELAILQQERRPGRPANMREDLLKQRIAVEEREYDGGFWIPDMDDEKNVDMLREWTGDWLNLNTLNFVRIDREGAKKESSWPPKGQS